MSSPTDLSQAIVLFLGFDGSPLPQRDAARLQEEFGRVTGAGLAREAEALVKEMMRITVNWDNVTFEAGVKAAEDQMRARHPELSDFAIGALGWVYAYDLK